MRQTPEMESRPHAIRYRRTDGRYAIAFWILWDGLYRLQFGPGTYSNGYDTLDQLVTAYALYDAHRAVRVS